MIKIDGIKGLVFNDGSTQQTAVTVSGLGSGQSYVLKTVGTERVMSTWYYNSFAKPILITVGRNGVDGASNTMYIQPSSSGSPTNIAGSTSIGNYGGAHSNITGIVPPYSYYQVTGNTVNFWAELTA